MVKHTWNFAELFDMQASNAVCIISLRCCCCMNIICNNWFVELGESIFTVGDFFSFLAEQTLHQYAPPTLALHWYLLTCHSLSHLSTSWDALFHTSTGLLSFPDLSPMQHGCHFMTHYLHWSSHWKNCPYEVAIFWPFSTISWITGFIWASYKKFGEFNV